MAKKSRIKRRKCLDILFSSAASKKLDSVPLQHLTSDNLLLRGLDNTGGNPFVYYQSHTFHTTTMHKAAIHCSLYQIPRGLLSQSSFAIKDDRGFTPLHLAAYSGALEQIPTEFITETLLLDRTGILDRAGMGQTVFHIAAEFGHLHQLPRQFLTLENMLIVYSGCSAIHIAAGNGHLDQLPEHIITTSTLSTPTCDASKYEGWTAYHFAAAKDQLHKLPNHTISKDTLKLKNSAGETPIHLAARYPKLKNIPKEILTEDIITIQDSEGTTPLHYIARNNNLHLLPKTALTARALLQPNGHGATPLHKAVLGGDTWTRALLGMTLPVEAKKIVGHEWWELNTRAIQESSILPNQEVMSEAVDLEF